MGMELLQLRYAVKTADSKSFARAAAEVEAVTREPVSVWFSLLYREFTGRFVKFLGFGGYLASKKPTITRCSECNSLKIVPGNSERRSGSGCT